ncbi:efflux RND transporter periplasmic adaptor subunit [Thiocapsa roseopersicina]|uniref:RND family efflux transporter, MFP subunit n=1 Tax=Thiocapsa roseopersicina TaxID=1058 RepID=A0A1H2ZLF5_THIRO|nr:HlyD family secretion protein [Thiocapsa roseopersicina]SDX17569.1 RND family efflux transporter, MFP subunit [Thiocapsa roseopersicina]
MSNPDAKQWILDSVRVLVTLSMVAIAAGAVYWAWQQAKAHPWTRDAQVLADVAHVAPRVGGQVTAVHVADNQQVAKGDLLFELDPNLYRQALAQAEADLALRRAEAADLREGAELRSDGDLSEADDDAEQALATAKAAAVVAAEITLATAQTRVDDTRVTAPVDGYVTNLQLKEGTFAAAGVPQVALVAADSFWVEAYFKETDLPDIGIGDPAAVTLMGYPSQPLTGRVESIAFGIERRNTAAGPGDLVQVEPMFEWIRLAQRIPVRIRLDEPPAGIVLRVGYSASVSVNPTTSASASLAAAIGAAFDARPPVAPDSGPASGSGSGPD